MGVPKAFGMTVFKEENKHKRIRPNVEVIVFSLLNSQLATQIMKILSLNTNIEVYENVEELNRADATLMEAAKKALEDAYAPYSKFKVGAALRLKNGKIIIGSNQENAAFPVTLCAERVAIFAAASQYPHEAIEALAITAKSGSRLVDKPITPCGSCRQVIHESEYRFKQPIRVILYGETGEVYVLETIKDILPLTFDANFL